MGRNVVILPSGCKTPFKAHEPHWWIERWFWPKIVDCPGYSALDKIREKSEHGG